MSDTAIEVTGTPPAPEPVAPALPQGQEAGGQVSPEKQAPLDRRSARSQAMERARQFTPGVEESAPTDEVAEATVDAKGRKHSTKDGKYLPGIGEEEEGEVEVDAELDIAEPDGEPAEEPQDLASDGEEEPPAAVAAEEFLVEVPEDHPLAHQGRDPIRAASQQDAERIRALLNGTYNRRTEVERAHTRAAELEKQNLELQRKLVSIEARDTTQKAWAQTPEYKAAVERYHDIKDNVGEEAASVYWEGIQGKLKEAVTKEEQNRWSKVEAEQAERAATEFTNDAWARVGKLPEYITALPELRNWFNDELQVFDQRVQRGEYNHLTSMDEAHQEFTRRLAMRLRNEPKVVAAYHAVKGKEKPPEVAAPAPVDVESVKQQAVEEYKKQLAAQRKKTPTNPLSALNGAADAGARPTTAIGEEAPPDAGVMSPTGRKRHFKETARAIARRHLGT